MVSYVACMDCDNDKIRLTSHSSFVMVSYVACTDWENDKIWLTSHSSFVMVSCVACMDCENDKIRWTTYSSFHMSHVQTVSVVGLMNWGNRDLDDEENVIDVKKRATNEERQTRLVNLCRHLHISVPWMALHINWLGKERMIELDVQSSKRGQGRESLQSPLILLYSLVAIVTML